MTDKPFSPACARNQDVILDVLRGHFADRRRVLEIGSGTGQHAVHFARALPQLVWQSSDVAAHLGGIQRWLDEAALANTPAPLSFDINGEPPSGRYDAVFSANTLHIMGWAEVTRLFERLPALLDDGALVAVYGPFNVNGGFTSPSNAAFDASLRAADPKRGIRDAEAVDALARAAGLALIADHPMPANNRTRVWRFSRSHLVQPGPTAGRTGRPLPTPGDDFS